MKYIIKQPHLLSIAHLSKKEILDLVKNAEQIKRYPGKFRNKMKDKVLLTFFQMPSLRTQLSFQTGMFQMGGSVIDYHSEHSPWANGKESIEDVAQVMSRYLDVIMMRIHDHNSLLRFAENSSIPVINGLTSYEHPCQILSDLLTIKEKKKKEWKRIENKNNNYNYNTKDNTKDNIKNNTLKIAYFGDSLNNVTHSLIFACAILGINLSIACPNKKEYFPDPKVLDEAKELITKYNIHNKIVYNKKINNNQSKIEVTNNPLIAAKDADVIYTDSWMSYRINPKEKNKRMSALKRFQVNSKVMKYAKKDAIFMHDLPALRGMEVTSEVIDGKQSVIFDQAENRLHMQKAILLNLLK